MDLTEVDSLIVNRGQDPFDILEVLHDLQARYGYLPEEVLRHVSARLAVPLIEVFRLANFYKAFSLKPRGRHLLTVCLGTACHVRGAPRMLDEVKAELGIGAGETTEDGAFTVETVNCLGACALGPVVVADGVYHEHMNPEKLRALLERLRSEDASLRAEGVGVCVQGTLGCGQDAPGGQAVVAGV